MRRLFRCCAPAQASSCWLLPRPITCAGVMTSFLDASSADLQHAASRMQAVAISRLLLSTSPRFPLFVIRAHFVARYKDEASPGLFAIAFVAFDRVGQRSSSRSGIPHAAPPRRHGGYANMPASDDVPVSSRRICALFLLISTARHAFHACSSPLFVEIADAASASPLSRR